MALGYRTFGRKGSQRKALFRDLITDLILNGSPGHGESTTLMAEKRYNPYMR